MRRDHRHLLLAVSLACASFGAAVAWPRGEPDLLGRATKVVDLSSRAAIPPSAHGEAVQARCVYVAPTGNSCVVWNWAEAIDHPWPRGPLPTGGSIISREPLDPELYAMCTPNSP